MTELNKKELRKSLKYWKGQFKQLKTALTSTYEEDSFMFEMLTRKKDEAEAIMLTLERQLGDKNEKKETKDN